MAQLTIPAGSFVLTSKYECFTNHKYYYTAAGSLVDSDIPFGYIAYEASTASRTVRFEYSLPEGAAVTNAQVCATLESSRYGSKSSSIAGAYANEGQTSQIAVSLVEGADYLDVRFVFQSNSVYHDHTADSEYTESWVYEDPNNNYCNVCTRTWVTEHEGELRYKDVYLLIEYTPPFTPPTLIPYTDPRLYVGETYVKAVHMTELHTNANLVRTAYRLPEYAFPPIVAMESLLARWNEDVIELRVALDEIGVEHEAWLVLDFNRPRLDVLLQLRRVVATLARGGEQEETDGVQLYTSDGALLMDANGLYFKAWEGN